MITVTTRSGKLVKIYCQINGDRMLARLIPEPDETLDVEDAADCDVAINRMLTAVGASADLALINDDTDPVKREAISQEFLKKGKK